MLPWFACAGGGSFTGVVDEIAIGFALVGSFSATIVNLFLLGGLCQFARSTPSSLPLDFPYCHYGISFSIIQNPCLYSSNL